MTDVKIDLGKLETKLEREFHKAKGPEEVREIINNLCNKHNEKIIKGLSLLVLCYSREDCPELIKELVDDPKVNINTKGMLERTPLMYACIYQDLDTIKYLVDHGANIYDVGQDKDEALILAFQRGDLEIAKYFIEEKGVDPFRKSSDGGTLLHCAAWGRNLELIKYLVEEKKLDINAKNCANETILKFACAAGNLEVVQYLVENGADINTKDERGETPFSWIKDKKIATFLKKAQLEQKRAAHRQKQQEKKEKTRKPSSKGNQR